MKKLVFLLGVLLMMSATSQAQDLKSFYFVGDVKIERVMINLVDSNKWEPYHLIERNHIRILFLNPEKDFTINSLNHALNKWERVSSPELELVILIDNKLNEKTPIPSFKFYPEDDFYIFQNNVYSVGRVEWGKEENNGNKLPLSKQMY